MQFLEVLREIGELMEAVAPVVPSRFGLDLMTPAEALKRITP